MRLCCCCYRHRGLFGVSLDWVGEVVSLLEEGFSFLLLFVVAVEVFVVEVFVVVE